MEIKPVPQRLAVKFYYINIYPSKLSNSSITYRYMKEKSGNASAYEIPCLNNHLEIPHRLFHSPPKNMLFSDQYVILYVIVLAKLCQLQALCNLFLTLSKSAVKVSPRLLHPLHSSKGYTNYVYGGENSVTGMIPALGSSRIYINLLLKSQLYLES